MNITPRTYKQEFYIRDPGKPAKLMKVVPSSLAREMEKELRAALSRIEELEKSCHNS